MLYGESDNIFAAGIEQRYFGSDRIRLEYVGYAFRGIQVCVIYLICSAGIKMLREMEKDFLSCAIVCVTVAAMTVLSFLSVSFSSVFYILIGGAVGVFAYFLSKIVGNKRKDGKK